MVIGILESLGSIAVYSLLVDPDKKEDYVEIKTSHKRVNYDLKLFFNMLTTSTAQDCSRFDRTKMK
jgi:hypothetical protein